MNQLLQSYLDDQIKLLTRLDTDKMITERKRHFSAQKMLLLEISHMNMNGDFDEGVKA